MRKWHRWVSVVIFLPILFIALTGVASQFAAIYARGGLAEHGAEHERPRGPAGPRPQASAAPGTALGLIPAAQAHEDEGDADHDAGPEAAPPLGATAAPGPALRRPPPTAAQRLVGTLHHLHSGESFGPVGTIVSIVSGLALIFFAISGMWMYIQMFLNRTKRTGRKELFWK